MIRLNNILVPTDFSETSAVALRYAQELAGQYGASLHLLHVVQDPLSQPWAADAYGLGSEVMEGLERHGRARLDKVLSEEERARFGARLVTVIGEPYLEILRYAKAQDIDLIVMGTHGHGPLVNTLMGSVAEKVVRRAPCPVLTVRHPEREFVLPAETREQAPETSQAN